MFAYIAADFFDFYEQIEIYLTIPLTFLVTCSVIPESPEYLLRKNKPEVLKRESVVIKKYLKVHS